MSSHEQQAPLPKDERDRLSAKSREIDVHLAALRAAASAIREAYLPSDALDGIKPGADILAEDNALVALGQARVRLEAAKEHLTDQIWQGRNAMEELVSGFDRPLSEDERKEAADWCDCALRGEVLESQDSVG